MDRISCVLYMDSFLHEIYKLFVGQTTNPTHSFIVFRVQTLGTMLSFGLGVWALNTLPIFHMIVHMYISVLYILFALVALVKIS